MATVIAIWLRGRRANLHIAAETGAAIAIKTDRTVAVMVTRGESLLSLTHVLVLDGSRRGGLVV